MAFTDVPIITTKFVGQPYDLNSVMGPDDVWAYLDSAPEEVRQALISLVAALNSATLGSSGSESLGSPTISGIDGNTVYAQIASLLAVAQAAQAGTITPGTVTDTMLSDLANQIKDRFAKHIIDNTKHIPPVVTTHVGNAYSVTVPNLTSLTDMYPLCVKFDAASTGNITVNPNSLGAKPVVDYFGNAVTNVRTGLIANLRYDATSGNFQLQGGNPSTTAYAVTTNIGNAYSVTEPNLVTLADGLQIRIKFNSASTGAITVNPNTLGAKNVVDYFGNAVTNVRANLIANLCYEATSGNFILQGKGGGGNATANQLALGATATVDSGPIVGTYLVTTTAGTNILVTPLAGDGTGVTNSTTYIKVAKRYTVKFGGIVRFRFSLSSDTVGTSNAQVYKNGLPVGTIRTVSSASQVQYDEDFSCNAGDYFEVYAKISSGGTYYATVTNINLLYALNTLATTT